jgi:hypothetical protein
MPVVKATDLAFGRLRAPDLDVMEEFLTHFGMVRSARTANALYMRGSGSAHHIHVTEKGDPCCVGFAYQAASEDDLRRLAVLPGASGVETVDEPGGGKRVRLTEPNGYQVEVLHGTQKLKPLVTARDPMNSADEPLRRTGRLMRLSKSPTAIRRIGHMVMTSPAWRRP